jgi:transposase-like protein
MSVAAFCRRAGVSPPSFYAWRTKLRKETAFVEVKVAQEERSSVAASGASGIELQLPRRRCIVVRRGFDRQTLVELLGILEEDSPHSMWREGIA